jgi:hypothetical protein
VAAHDYRVRRYVRECVTAGAVACVRREDTSFLPAFSFAVMVVCGCPDSEEASRGGGAFAIPVLGVVVRFSLCAPAWGGNCLRKNCRAEVWSTRLFADLSKPKDAFKNFQNWYHDYFNRARRFLCVTDDTRSIDELHIRYLHSVFNFMFT